MQTIEKENLNIRKIIFSFLRTAGIILVATGVALLLEMHASNVKNNIIGVYMLSVVVVTTVTPGYIWGILASVAGVVGVNYFFTFPYFAINFLLDGYPVTFLMMLLLSCISSALMGKIKKQALIAQAREKRFEYLYTINKDLLSTFGMDNIIELMLEHFNRLGKCSVVYYQKDPRDFPVYRSKLEDESHLAIFAEPTELEAAHYVYENKETVGAGTESFGQAKAIYLPIISHDRIYGLVGILFLNPDLRETETVKFIEVMVLQFILAMDRQTLFDKQQKILIETEKEKMRSNLLRAVSHDLRTPLTCIQGSSATLLENKETISEEIHDKLLQDIQSDCQWLIHMVENLLSVTRISDKKASVKKQMEAVEEVVAESVMRIKKRFSNCCLQVEAPDEFLMAPMDATLIEQVIINLVENSIRHSKATKPIQLRILTSASGEDILFQVSDNGIGIAEERLQRLFDGSGENHFNDSSRGLGIGLSICKSIILAHGGQIRAQNNQSGGVTFTFSLPLKGVKE